MMTSNVFSDMGVPLVELKDMFTDSKNLLDMKPKNAFEQMAKAAKATGTAIANSKRALKVLKSIGSIKKELLDVFLKCSNLKDSPEVRLVLRVIELYTYNWGDFSNSLFLVIKDWGPMMKRIDSAALKIDNKECRAGGEIIGQTVNAVVASDNAIMDWVTKMMTKQAKVG